MAHLTLFYPDGVIAYLNVNWLAPVKIRQTFIGGSKRMILYDDLQASEKVEIYDLVSTLRRAAWTRTNSASPTGQATCGHHSCR